MSFSCDFSITLWNCSSYKIIGFLWVQELPTVPESIPSFSEVQVVRSLVFCVVFFFINHNWLYGILEQFRKWLWQTLIIVRKHTKIYVECSCQEMHCINVTAHDRWGLIWEWSQTDSWSQVNAHTYYNIRVIWHAGLTRMCIAIIICRLCSGKRGWNSLFI